MEVHMNCERFQQCSCDFSHTILRYLLVLFIWRLTSVFTRLIVPTFLLFQYNVLVSHTCFDMLINVLTHNTRLSRK